MGKIMRPMILIALAFIYLPSCVTVQSSDFLKNMGGSLAGTSASSGLTEDRIVEGLKEALRIGTDNAVNSLSIEGSFLNNPEVKIPLPGPLKKIEEKARKVGLGFYFDSFEKSINTAAEKATPHAKKIVFSALKQMTFSDAKKILYGRDNEASLYFKEKSFNELMNIFKPEVHSVMSNTGVTKKYQEIEARVRALPFIEALPLNFDLDKYVAENALNGIFYMIEKEEKKIRENPAARITELLRDVLAGKNRVNTGGHDGYNPPFF